MSLFLVSFDVYMSLFICGFVLSLICSHVSVCVCVPVCMCLCVFVCVCVCLCVYDVLCGTAVPSQQNSMCGGRQGEY